MLVHDDGKSNLGHMWSWTDLAKDLTTVVATEYPATVEMTWFFTGHLAALWGIREPHGREGVHLHMALGLLHVVLKCGLGVCLWPLLFRM